MTLRRSHRVIIVATAIFLAGTCVRGDEMSLDDIRKRVQESEALYSDLDIRFVQHRKNGPGAIKLSNPSNPRIRPSTEDRFHVWSLRQGGMYRVEVMNESLLEDGRVLNINHAKMFDGEVTRALIDEKVANVRQGYSGDSWILHPHMMLLRRAHFSMRLSVLLAGGDALVHSPEAGWSADSQVACEYRGPSNHDGRIHHNVRITSSKSTTARLQIDIALDENRNFIPAKATWTYLLVSTEQPVDEAEVVEWSELRPGVWLPEETRLVSWNPIFLKYGQGKHEQWTTTISVESASLAPHYSRATFQQMDIPDGAAVYESTGTDINRSYWKGGISDPELGKQPMRRWATVWVGMLSLVVAIAILCLFKKSKQHEASKSGDAETLKVHTTPNPRAHGNGELTQ